MCSLSMLPAVTSVVLPVPTSAKVAATSEYSAYQLGVQRNDWLQPALDRSTGSRNISLQHWEFNPMHRAARNGR